MSLNLFLNDMSKNQLPKDFFFKMLLNGEKENHECFFKTKVKKKAFCAMVKKKLVFVFVFLPLSKTHFFYGLVLVLKTSLCRRCPPNGYKSLRK